MKLFKKDRKKSELELWKYHHSTTKGFFIWKNIFLINYCDYSINNPSLPSRFTPMENLLMNEFKNLKIFIHPIMKNVTLFIIVFTFKNINIKTSDSILVVDEEMYGFLEYEEQIIPMIIEELTTSNFQNRIRLLKLTGELLTIDEKELLESLQIKLVFNQYYMNEENRKKAKLFSLNAQWN